MSSIRERFEIGVAFDVLLHQPALLHTLHLMLQLVTDRLCIALPVLAELETHNALVYLPGNPDPNLYPLSERSPGVLMFDPLEVNSDYWIWGITRQPASQRAHRGRIHDRQRARRPDATEPTVGLVGLRRRTNFGQPAALGEHDTAAGPCRREIAEPGLARGGSRTFWR